MFCNSYWEYSRVAILDKIILRIAYLELMFFPDIPPEATMNEAMTPVVPPATTGQTQ